MFEVRSQLTRDTRALWGMVKDCAHGFFGDGQANVYTAADLLEWFWRTATYPLFGYVNGEAATMTYLTSVDEGEQASIHALVFPEFRRPDVSIPLGRMCISRYFDELNLHKIQGVVAAYNRPARIMCKRLGFQQDGILREHMVYLGKRRDCVLYSLLRSEHHG